MEAEMEITCHGCGDAIIVEDDEEARGEGWGIASLADEEGDDEPETVWLCPSCWEE
jgi:hypothetical protein